MVAHLVLICTVKLLTGWSYLESDLCLDEKLSGICPGACDVGRPRL